MLLIRERQRVVDAIIKAQGKWEEVVGWFDPDRNRAPRPRRDAAAEGEP